MRTSVIVVDVWTNMSKPSNWLLLCDRSYLYFLPPSWEKLHCTSTELYKPKLKLRRIKLLTIKLINYMYTSINTFKETVDCKISFRNNKINIILYKYFSLNGFCTGYVVNSTFNGTVLIQSWYLIHINEVSQ